MGPSPNPISDSGVVRPEGGVTQASSSSMTRGHARVQGGSHNGTTSGGSGLATFLQQFRVDKGCVYTHTSFARPAGSFYVPAQSFAEFMARYKAAVVVGEDVHITERHRDIGPVIVDLDFRFNLVDGPASISRTYTSAMVDDFVRLYGSVLSRYVHRDTFDVYILEKQTGPTIVKNLVKDGLHLTIPDVVTRPAVQYLVRQEVLKGLPGVLDVLGLANGYEDVMDESIIERNNWLMYMSKKPSSEPYVVTRVLRYSSQTHELTDVTGTTDLQVENLVDCMSLRNKFDATPIHEEVAPTVRDFEQQQEERRLRKELVQSVLSSKPCTTTNTCDNVTLIENLVSILSPTRCDTYTEWIRVGWCLRNIDHRLLDKWIEFSRQSPKYVEGECARLWAHMRMGGLGMGTLHMWARTDSPERYKEIIRADLAELIRKAVSGTHYDVACVVHHMYRYQYVCASLRNRVWYEFRDHRWHPSDCACSLRRHISTTVYGEFMEAASALARRAAAVGDTNEAEQKQLSDTSIKLIQLAQRLKTKNFKDNIIAECSELFYERQFEEKLDSNCNLLGFLNGVYDLDAQEFREGRPDDYLSYTTGINYVPFSDDLPYLDDIRRFWSQVLPNEDIREYVLTLLASFLSGHTREERFHIWTGSGSNGKSLSVELFDKALGDYTCKFPVTLLTQKRAASNAATSEVARAKGRRFACLQEPSEDEKLNIGLLKELTGGDKVMARAIYKEPVEFKPQWHIALLCNHLPNVPSDDGGTWRRIRVVEFTSKFVEKPVAENEFPIDMELSRKIEDWKESFMALLIEYYKTRYAGGQKIKEPEEVLKCTREYQKNNDHYADFIDTCIEKVNNPTAILQSNDVFQVLKQWVKQENIQMALKKKDLNKYLERVLGKPSAAGKGSNHQFRGYTLSLPGEDDNMDPLD